MAFVPPPRKKTILDNSKLKFSAAKLPDGTGRPQAAIFLNGANLRISVYTNVNNQIFDARMDLLTAQTFFDLIDHVADEGVENIESIEVLRVKPFDEYGSPIEIISHFGNKQHYLEAVKELENELYRKA